jgi:hypothetical protein
MGDTSVTYEVVTEVAEQKDVPPEELRPLSDVVDPEALDTLFASAPGTDHREGRVSFAYEGLSVTIDQNGSISVTASQQDGTM